MNEYKFLQKTPELVAQRRVALDYHANLAQSSQLVLHLSLAVGAIAFSSQIKKLERSYGQKGGATPLARTAKSLQNTLGTEVTKGFGTYGQWIFGIVWTAWLVYLCAAETSPDYLHLTKRFGLIAASQLPIHYLLATTRQLNKAFRLNMALHKVTGKIILAFFGLHVSFYLYFFAQAGILWTAVQNTYIVVALISAGIYSVLGFTSVHSFRRKNYAWFYRVHVVGSAVVLPLLYFHVVAIRAYLIESGAVLLVNAAYRILGSRAKTN